MAEAYEMPKDNVTYPKWIVRCFVCSIAIGVIALLSLLVAPLYGSKVSVTIDFLLLAIALGSLSLIVQRAEQIHGQRRT